MDGLFSDSHFEFIIQVQALINHNCFFEENYLYTFMLGTTPVFAAKRSPGSALIKGHKALIFDTSHFKSL